MHNYVLRACPGGDQIVRQHSGIGMTSPITRMALWAKRVMGDLCTLHDTLLVF